MTVDGSPESVQSAYFEGVNAYPDVGTWECPYPEGSEERAAWLLGRSIEAETLDQH